MKKYYASLLILFMVICSTSSVFAFNMQYWDLVDSGKHCDYDGNSAYMSSFSSGATSWNTIRSIFRPDSIYVTEDIYISDGASKVNNVIATTSADGTIVTNPYNMNSLNSTYKKSVAMHELGHCLGLDHSNDIKDVMYSSCYGVTSISSDDSNGVMYMYNYVY